MRVQRVSNGAAAAPGFENLARDIAGAIGRAGRDGAARLAAELAAAGQWQTGGDPAVGIRLVAGRMGERPRKWMNSGCRPNMCAGSMSESGVPADKVVVVPNGVDPEKFHPQAAPMKLATERQFKFLFVGGTIFRKGPDFLLKAFWRQFYRSRRCLPGDQGFWRPERLRRANI